MTVDAVQISALAPLLLISGAGCLALSAGHVQERTRRLALGSGASWACLAALAVLGPQWMRSWFPPNPSGRGMWVVESDGALFWTPS